MEGYVKGFVVGKTLSGSLIVQTVDEDKKTKTRNENLVIVSTDDFNLPDNIVGFYTEVEGSVYFSDGRNVFLSDEIIIRFPQHDQGSGMHPATIYRSDGTIETPEDRERREKENKK